MKVKALIAWITIAPFIRNAVYIIFLHYSASGAQWGILWDLTFHLSPMVCLTDIVLSYLAGLCMWHRMVSLAPMFNFIPILFQMHGIKLPFISETSTIIQLIITTLILGAINVFIINKSKHEQIQKTIN